MSLPTHSAWPLLCLPPFDCSTLFSGLPMSPRRQSSDGSSVPQSRQPNHRQDGLESGSSSGARRGAQDGDCCKACRYPATAPSIALARRKHQPRHHRGRRGVGFALCSKKAFFSPRQGRGCGEGKQSTALAGASCGCSSQARPGMLSVTRLFPPSSSQRGGPGSCSGGWGRGAELAQGERLGRRQRWGGEATESKEGDGRVWMEVSK